MPVRVSSSPKSTAAPAGPTITWVGDGTIKLSDGRILSLDEVASIKQVLSDQKQILILNTGEDADTLFNTGMQGLHTAYFSDLAGQVAASIQKTLRGVHLKFGVGTGAMVAGAARVAKVPTTDGLVPAGQAAVLVMKKYPGETFNAAAQVDPAQLGGQCQGLDLHVQLRQVYDTASGKVQPGCVYLADQVCTAAAIVNGAIQEALPINEDLSTDAAPLTGYFGDPVELAKKTKKVVQKVKDQTTQAVTSSVQAKALDQARTEIKGELAGKLDSMVDSVVGASTASK